MQHTHIKGLTAKLASFEGIVEDIRHRPYDLLNFEATQFDRDFLEFNVHIHDLELTLQVGFVYDQLLLVHGIPLLSSACGWSCLASDGETSNCQLATLASSACC